MKNQKTPRSLKEAFEGYAQEDLPEAEFNSQLDRMERDLEPLVWVVMVLAALVIIAQVMEWI